jgi:hypothetical protein
LGNHGGQVSRRQAGFWAAAAEVEMLKSPRSGTEDVAGEEGTTETEGAEAGRHWEQQVGGTGAVHHGETPEVSRADGGEVDSAEAAAAPDFELPEAGAGADHPAQRRVGEGHGAEVDHLQRPGHGVSRRGEVEPPHGHPREQRAPHREVHGEHARAARAPARAPPAGAVEAEAEDLHLARRRVLDAAPEVGLRELARVEGEREAVHPAPPAAVDGGERPRRRRRAGRQAEPERGGVRPALRPEAPPPRGERAGADGRLERQQAQNLQPQRLRQLRDAVLLAPSRRPPPLLVAPLHSEQDSAGLWVREQRDVSPAAAAAVASCARFPLSLSLSLSGGVVLWLPIYLLVIRFTPRLRLARIGRAEPPLLCVAPLRRCVTASAFAPSLSPFFFPSPFTACLPPSLSPKAEK